MFPSTTKSEATIEVVQSIAEIVTKIQHNPRETIHRAQLCAYFYGNNGNYSLKIDLAAVVSYLGNISILFSFPKAYKKELQNRTATKSRQRELEKLINSANIAGRAIDKPNVHRILNIFF